MTSKSGETLFLITGTNSSFTVQKMLSRKCDSEYVSVSALDADLSPAISSAIGARDELEPNSRQVEASQGQAQQKEGDLTNDDLDRVEGKREGLVGVVQERYGIARECTETLKEESNNEQSTDERGLRSGAGHGWL